MLSRIRGELKNKKGSALVFTIILMVMLIGFTGMVVDSGLAYANKLHMQKAARAAVLSGAQEIAIDQALGRQIANEVLEAHKVDDDFYDMEVSEDRIKVRLKKMRKTYFIRIFGIDEVDIAVESTAQIMIRSGGVGVSPIGIDEGIDLIVGEEYTLKLDEINTDSGWFGALGIDGPGASLYEKALKEGAETSVSVGDIIETETGNIAGPTRDAVNYLINKCEDEYDHDSVSDCVAAKCPRILLVPVYIPVGDKKLIKEVEITGFAYFYLLEEMGNKDKEIHGQFVEMYESGEGDDSVTDHGAYSIVLVDD